MASSLGQHQELPEDVRTRARLHAALGDPYRLAIAESLALSDRSPSELSSELHLASNLLAHHLGVLKEAGIVREVISSGDKRRRYVQLNPDAPELLPRRPLLTPYNVLFVCTRNSARSQLAAALFSERTGMRAASGGTHPAPRIHPRAVEAARRYRLRLENAAPRAVSDAELRAGLVVTVCDQAHEELSGKLPRALHWSVPDPVAADTDEAFDEAHAVLQRRMRIFKATTG
ncbi:MAG: helix-turn-helix domain-containing protein [SAR202 cluster bacterium]|nr:helix-turn-helix domain-containing protein [SAR202 cluster bacterium]